MNYYIRTTHLERDTKIATLNKKAVQTCSNSFFLLFEVGNWTSGQEGMKPF